jgi:hypothetical protein
LTHPNTFFDDTIEKNLHMVKFRRALFDVALETNQIAVLKLLCKDVYDMQAGDLLYYFYIKFGFELDANVSW